MINSIDSASNGYSIRISRIVQLRHRRVQQSGRTVRSLRRLQMHQHQEAVSTNRDHVVYLLDEALSISTPNGTISINCAIDEETGTNTVTSE
jgi:hypothetical protein